MAWNAAPSPPVAGGAPPPRRRGAVAVLLSLALAPVLPGCETLDRMDYLDRFFEPASRPIHAAAPVTEPVQTSVDAPPPATGWSPQPTAVVAMDPVQSPGDRWSSTERSAAPHQAVARAAVPRPEPGVPSPAADPESRTRSLVRQNPWLTRFWMELTPAQQARVERQLHRGGGDVRPVASGPAEPAAAWDSMGLSDRANLVFGKGASPDRPAPPIKERDTIPLADDS